MKSSGVIVRFLSLLDVALILLGVLMLALMQTTVSTNAQAGDSGAQEASVLDRVNFIYLYAGWKGDQRLQCYLLDERMKLDRKVSTSSKEDIEAVLTESQGTSEPTNVVMLLFEDDGWFTGWDDKINGLEDTWGVKVVPIYNVAIDP